MTVPALIDTAGQPLRSAPSAPPRMRAGLTEGPGNAFPYDAQVPYSQDMENWQPWLRSPDSEINLDRDRVVARTRDLVRNNGWAKGGIITRIADAVIGADFHPIPTPNWRALSHFDKAFDATWAAEYAAAVRSEWTLWADDLGFHSDAARTLTMTQQFYLSYLHFLIDGECLGMLLWAPERVGAGGARYSTTLQGIDPDRLSNPYQMVDTHDRRGGVQVDDLGAPVGYHIRRAHQNDWYDAALSMEWDFFPRETPWGRPITVHYYDKEREDQHRGNSILMPMLSRFKMLDKYDTTALQAAVLRTIVGFFLKSPYDPEQVRNALDAGVYGEDGDISPFTGELGARAAWHAKNRLSLGGVRMPLLAPGESIETASGGSHATDFDAFETSFLRNFAAGTGQSYEEVSGDFRHTNYSSFRGAMQQSWRTLTRRRGSFAPRYAAQVYGAWLEEALDPKDGHLADVLPRNAPAFPEMRTAFAMARWIGPGRGWVDPLKEPQGEVLKLDAGLTTLSDSASTISGRYYLDLLDEREVEQAQMKKRGLKLPDWAGGQPAQQIAAKPEDQ